MHPQDPVEFHHLILNGDLESAQLDGNDTLTDTHT